MSDFKDCFDHIRMQLIELEKCWPGKMMSCEGITYKTKVFDFYYKDSMVCHLRRVWESLAWVSHLALEIIEKELG